MARKGRITVDPEFCKGCGICIPVCPMKILAFNKDVTNSKGYHPMYCVEPDKCIGCGSCGIMCPDAAITVERE